MEDVERLLKGTVEELDRLLNAKNVLAEPIEKDGATIIPMLSYGFGFGAGGGADQKKGQGHGTGGGGGIKPIGAIIIDKDGARVEGLKGAMTSLVGAIGGAAALYWEDDPCDHVFEVVSGILRLCKLTADGRRQVTGFVYAGHFVGMARDDAYIHTAEAVTPCQVRSFTPGQLSGRTESDPGLTRHFLSMAINDLLAAQERMLLLGRKTAVERLASFLLELAGRRAQAEQDATEIHLPMTRSDIADYLGLTLETVSRLFTRLRVSGIIAMHQAHRVKILDPTRLLATADDQHACSLH